MKINVMSLFSGCSGSDLGMEQAGLNVVMAVEAWEPALRTYKYNFNRPALPLRVEDVKRKFYPKEEIHCIIGGPPCTTFSLAKTSNKMNCEGLEHVKEFQRIVKDIQPPLFVMENVPTMMSYSAVMNTVLNGFNPYLVFVKVLKTEDFGLPQSRERLFFFGVLKNYGKLEFGMRIPLFPWNRYWSGWAEYLDIPRDRVLQVRGDKFIGRIWNEPAFTVTGVDHLTIRTGGPKVMHRGLSYQERINYGVHTRMLTVKECAKLQGFPSHFHFIGNKDACYRMIGNAWSVPVAKAIGTEIERVITLGV